MKIIKLATAAWLVSLEQDLKQEVAKWGYPTLVSYLEAGKSMTAEMRGLVRQMISECEIEAKILRGLLNMKSAAQSAEIKTAETVSASELFRQFLAEGKTPEAAAEEVLGIMSQGAFDAIEEPQRGQAIQQAIRKYSPRSPSEIMQNLPVRRVSIRCIEHPEWGTFGVMEDKGSYYEIYGTGGTGGSRVLEKAEAARFWEIVSYPNQNYPH